MLWLHPTVVGHEFGHHFFSEFAPDLLFYNQHGSTVAAKIRIVDQRSVISSINEGFADLVAHYTFHSGTLDFGSVRFSGAAQSRDPGADRNDDDLEKALNRSVIKHYFSSEVSLLPELSDSKSSG